MPADAAKLKAATTYNAAADHFDDAPLAFWARIGQRTVDRLPLRAGHRVLDVGCGTGASAIPAAERVGPTGQIIGVDLAERLLSIGRQKAKARQLANLQFETADMERLGYPDASFDAIVSVFSIFFVPDMTKQVRELWRMVRPGGWLAITTWGPRMFQPGTSTWWSSVGDVRPDLANPVSPWERIVEPQALKDLFLEAGLPAPEIAAEESRQPLRSPDDWWTIVLGSGFRWTVEQLGPEAAEKVRQRNLKLLRASRVASVETNALFATVQKLLG